MAAASGWWRRMGRGCEKRGTSPREGHLAAGSRAKKASPTAEVVSFTMPSQKQPVQPMRPAAAASFDNYRM